MRNNRGRGRFRWVDCLQRLDVDEAPGDSMAAPEVGEDPVQSVVFVQRDEFDCERLVILAGAEGALGSVGLHGAGDLGSRYKRD